MKTRYSKSKTLLFIFVIIATALISLEVIAQKTSTDSLGIHELNTKAQTNAELKENTGAKRKNLSNKKEKVKKNNTDLENGFLFKRQSRSQF